MKKLALLFTCLLLIATAFSQSQQGFVRTLGRPDKKGEALGGVTVRVKGQHNPVLSNVDGTFSFTLPDLKNGDAYALQQVKKNGYELNDNDLIGRQQAFSDKVRLEIVMVSLEQLQAEKQRIEDKAFATAQRNYQAKADELEQQLATNKISSEKYNEAIKDLIDKYEKYQSLIDGLAEHYAHTDYDLLDEKDREINLCIENGDLERADSLIRLLFNPLDALQRNKKALAELDRQIGQARGIIEKANADMASVLKQQNKDAEYLYQLYSIALARFDNKKAEYYIETRAALDTTNGEWQHEAADYYLRQNQFNKAQSYYNKAIQVYREKAKEYPETNEPDLANALNSIGEAYRSVMFHFPEFTSKCEQAFSEAVEILLRLSNEDMETYGTECAGAISNLGNYYLAIKDLDKAKAAYEEAVKLQRKHLKTASDQESYYVLGVALGNLGHVYDLKNDYKKGEANLTESLEIYRKLVQDNPERFEETLAKILGVLSSHYLEAKQETKSNDAFNESVALYRKLAQNDPQRYEPQLANQLLAHGTYLLKEYSNQNKPLDQKQKKEAQKPLAMVEEAKNLFESYSNIDPVYKSLYIDALKQLYLFDFLDDPMKCNLIFEEYRQNLAESNDLAQSAQEFIRILTQGVTTSETEIDNFTIGNIILLADNYRKAGRYSESEALLKDCLQIRRRLLQKGLRDYEPALAAALSELGNHYTYELDRYTEAEPLLTASIEIYQRLAQDLPDKYGIKLAISKYNLGSLYSRTERTLESLTCWLESLQTCDQIAKNDPSCAKVRKLTKELLDEWAPYLKQTADDYRDEKQYEQSKAHYLKVLEIYRYLAIADPANNLPEIASALNSFGILYINNQQYADCEACFKESYEIYKKLALTDPGTYQSEVDRMDANLKTLTNMMKKAEGKNQ